MAKLQEYRAGKFRFKLRGKYFYLPGLTKRDAESVQEKVEKLASAKTAGSIIPDRIAFWLGECPDEMYRKLAEIELVEPRAAKHSCNLLRFIDEYIARRTDVSESTVTLMKKARTAWADRNPADLLVSSVTVADAKDFKRRLTDEGYASTTVCQHCKKLRQFFSAAVDAELIVANPFLKVRLSSKVDEDRQEFIPREAIDRVLTKCPDAEFRLLVCLSRYGGLRCPSESDVLCWSDIDFEAGEFVVRSQKTGPRVVPLFPELVEPLRDAFEAAAEGSRHVIVRHRGAVRRQMGRVVERAGLEPWPKIFQNLRSSRETELIEQFPIHVVCKWIGNSPTIAHRHYLQVTPDHMELARSKIPMNPASLDLV